MRDNQLSPMKDTTMAVLPPAPPAPGPRGRGWAWRLLITVAAAWLVMVVVHLSFSGRWWGAFPTDLVPPVLYVAVPCLLLLLAPLAVRRRRRWVAATAVLSLVLGLDLSGVNWSAFAGEHTPPGTPVRVMAWNTEYWDQGQSSSAFYSYLRSRHADVYLLQEYIYFSGDEPRPIDKLAELKRAFPGYHIIARGELVTLTRLPVVSSRVLAASPLPPDDTDWHAYWADKVLRTDVRVGGKTVSFYDAHIPTPIGGSRNPASSAFFHQAEEGFNQREPQIDALNADVDRNPHPVLVAGDFNTTPAMGDIDNITGSLTDAIGANRSVDPVSWPDRGTLPPFMRLDWTFTNKRMDVTRYAFEDSEGLSDHRSQSVTAVVR
ncbi:endonuclease/exonuclease/phosphatase family protein [Streptomyces sp. DW26H14]|uniref:endonuclease/exonuclease/phosphatase family protein n=1 Tax=Streptomyces sp. DW26H14 TaxID=3435395 RepID=UPI00403D5BD9